MSIDDKPMPIELLRDHRGIYGIGVADAFDHEMIALRCGLGVKDPFLGGVVPPSGIERTPEPLIMRPDRFGQTKPTRAALQRITGGFRHGIFCHTHEERLRQVIHHEALRRAGLPWPRPHDLNGHCLEYWSDDRAQQMRNRGIYHGLRVLSLGVINRLIGELHEAVADQDAIRAARRFQFRHREDIYRAAALSRRALQLTDVFPVAASVTYAGTWPATTTRHDWRSFEKLMSEQEQRQCDAANLVERGARLRDVAAALGFPLALRHVKPGVAHLVSDIFVQYPELLQWMPATTPAAKIWLKVVAFAERRGDVEYARWAARHIPQSPGRENQVGNTIADLLDWVRASEGNSGFITRRFNPAMGLKGAIEASDEWHEAVASNMDAPDGRPLPPPWFPAATQGDFEIVPIETAADLYREGREMHHCVGSYADDVRKGSVYVYSVRKAGQRVATMSLVRDFYDQAEIDQVRGPCNAAPSKPIMTAVRQWLRAQPAIQPRRHCQDLQTPTPAEPREPAEYEDEIPF